jgi:hypothetical protein
MSNPQEQSKDDQAFSRANPESAQPSQHDLTQFNLGDMVQCGIALRQLATDSVTMEAAARKVTRYLYDNLRRRDGRSCALVRFFKTHRYVDLPPELRGFAAMHASSAPLGEDVACLTLLATAGDEPQWNSRQMSLAHKSIPLPSEAILERFPMIFQLIRQFGLKTTEVLSPTPSIIQDLSQKQFGVFHVPSALGSQFVPAQNDFVVPFRIASVLGFGGMFPNGSLFAVIIFARVAIPTSTAEMFGAIGLNLKLGLLTILDQPVFDD